MPHRREEKVVTYLQDAIDQRHRLIRLCLLPLLLTACAIKAPPSAMPVAAPDKWQAPLPAAGNADAPANAQAQSTASLPHGGVVTNLSQWWRLQGDPLLARLIEAAQAVSPSIAAATSRIEQARATRVAAGAALGPSLDATASIGRNSIQPPLPMGTTSQEALQAAWEIDLFGANRAARNAAQARFEGMQAGWHDARVSVAAESANLYYSKLACEKTLEITLSDAASRAETARLTDLSAQAGFQAPATAALARASAAEASGRVMQQRALCDVDVKGLVALTAIPEPELRQQFADVLQQSSQQSMLPEATAISSLPAQILAQRPDIFMAEREVAAASADASSAQAQRYPRLSLSGSIGAANFRAGGDSTSLTTWAIGPLAVSIPLFDGGRRAANAEAALARYDEAAANYRASVRRAVREVEEALVNLQSTAARSENTRAAVDGYRASFDSTQARYQSGLASLVELEESRRTRLAAELTLVTLERERRAAWVALYRAAGGGWSRADLPAPSEAVFNTGATGRTVSGDAASNSASLDPAASGAVASGAVASGAPTR